jgi:DNA-binding MarR family transcriptional regulator
MSPDLVDKILAQWQKERPDIDASPMGILGRSPRLAKYLTKEMNKIFAKFGLNPGEFDVLATLRRSGKPYQLSPTDLYNSVMVTSGTMTHRIDGLEKAKLVERVPDPSDRRSTLIRLTDKGFDLIEKAVEAHVENGHRLLNVLEESELQTLNSLLRKLLVSLEGS